MSVSPHVLADLGTVSLQQLEPRRWHLFFMHYDTQPSGSPLTFPVCLMRGDEPGPRVTIVSGVHGDEFEGVRALWHLLHRPDFRIDRGVLVLVPIAHPAAYNAGTRTNPLDGLNLARVFPGIEHGTTTERLAFVLFHQVVRASNLVIDLHSGGIRYLHAPLAGFYDLPDAVGAQSFALAKATGWKYLWAAPFRPGVLSYECARYGIPSLGTEVGGAGRCLPDDVALYRPTLQRIFHHAGLVDEGAHELDVPAQVIVDGDWLLTPGAGFLEPTVELDQHVTVGQVLGYVLDSFGGPVAEIHAQDEGVIVGIRAYPPILAGEWGMFVGRVRTKEAQ
jgi:predicted deacylase